MTETNIPEINVEEIMQRIREEVARRKQGTASHDPGPITTLASKTELPSSVQLTDESEPPLPPCPVLSKPHLAPVAQSLPIQESYNLGELLGYHDTEFITNAYSAILRRSADHDGTEHYLMKLRNGELTKAEILGRLRFSPEGRRGKISVKGLLFPFVIQSSFKIPVLGWLLRVLIGVVNLPAILKNMQVIENTVFCQRDLIGEQAKVIHSQLTLLRDHVANLQDEIVKKLVNKALKKDVQKIQQYLTTTTAQIDKIISQVGEQLTETETKLKDEIGQLSETVSAAKSGFKEELVYLNDHLSGTETGLKDDINQVGKLLTETETKFKDEIGQLSETVSAAESGFKEELVHLSDHLSGTETGLKDEINQVGKLLTETEIILKNDISQVAESVVAAETHLSEETQHLSQKVLNYRRNLTDQERRIALFLNEARKRLPEPFSQEQLENLVSEENHLYDAMYVAFEDQFRGTREDIKERQAVYLPYVEKAIKQTDGGGKILDIGCGRGEWLELLKEHGYKAKGVDINRVMVEESKALGLEVVATDGLTYLHDLPANSLAALTGFHIVEHLAHEVLILLFDEALRILKPGGVVIFETPNPENLIVGACNFYFDMTHRNPLPPLPLQFLLESRGFVNNEIKRLHPVETASAISVDTPEELKELYGFFRCSQDYAVIGWKS